jgi:hypothetical protein
MVRIAASLTAPGPETPMRTSAPRSTSSALPPHVVAVRALGERGALGVELRAAAVQRALAVADDDVADPVGEHDVRAGQARRPRADHDDPDVLGGLAHDAQGVDEGGEDHHRGAVLVVVEHRDVELRAQAPLDLEAAREPRCPRG